MKNLSKRARAAHLYLSLNPPANTTSAIVVTRNTVLATALTCETPN